MHDESHAEARLAFPAATKGAVRLTVTNNFDRVDLTPRLPEGCKDGGFVTCRVSRFLLSGDCSVRVAYWNGVEWIPFGKIKYSPAKPRACLLPFYGNDDYCRYGAALKSQLEVRGTVLLEKILFFHTRWVESRVLHLLHPLGTKPRFRMCRAGR